MRPACSLMSSVIGRESSQIQKKGVIIVKFLVKHITMYPQLITLERELHFVTNCTLLGNYASRSGNSLLTEQPIGPIFKGRRNLIRTSFYLPLFRIYRPFFICRCLCFMKDAQ
jgi:hypothetical protein